MDKGKADGGQVVVVGMCRWHQVSESSGTDRALQDSSRRRSFEEAQHLTHDPNDATGGGWLELYWITASFDRLAHPFATKHRPFEPPIDTPTIRSCSTLYTHTTYSPMRPFATLSDRSRVRTSWLLDYWPNHTCLSSLLALWWLLKLSSDDHWGHCKVIGCRWRPWPPYATNTKLRHNYVSNITNDPLSLPFIWLLYGNIQRKQGGTSTKTILQSYPSRVINNNGYTE